jgi:hypothetical protein
MVKGHLVKHHTVYVMYNDNDNYRDFQYIPVSANCQDLTLLFVWDGVVQLLIWISNSMIVGPCTQK